MAGLWRNNSSTPEGKYPIVLRRDGSPLTARYFVLALKDPAAQAALEAYAVKAGDLGYDSTYVRDVEALAAECFHERELAEREGLAAGPDAPPHRTDDATVLAWARSIGCPGS